MALPPKPLEVRAPRGARSLQLLWSDGQTATFDHRHLRAFCPCATCQGHQGGIVWTADADQLEDTALELIAVEPVGHYALRFAWGDGHHTGIYSFVFLRQLQRLAELPAEQVRGQHFPR